MEEKQYYVYGGVGMAIVLLGITLFSFFSSSKGESLAEKSKNIKKEEVTETKKYQVPEVKFVPMTSTSEKYVIKTIKLEGLPAGVSEVMNSAYTEKERSFVNIQTDSSIKLETENPQIYQSGEYISIVTTFVETYGAGETKKETKCWTYSQESGKIVELPTVFQAEDKKEIIYEYLLSSMESLITNSIVENAKKVGFDAEGQRTDIEKSVLKRLKSRNINFFNWYLDGNEIVFIFNPMDFVSFDIGEQKVSIKLAESINYLKAQK